MQTYNISNISNLGSADLRGVPARHLLAEVQRAGCVLGTHDGAGGGISEVRNEDILRWLMKIG